MGRLHDVYYYTESRQLGAQNLKTRSKFAMSAASWQVTAPQCGVWSGTPRRAPGPGGPDIDRNHDSLTRPQLKLQLKSYCQSEDPLSTLSVLKFVFSASCIFPIVA